MRQRKRIAQKRGRYSSAMRQRGGVIVSDFGSLPF
jgi:hypothetical protein